MKTFIRISLILSILAVAVPASAQAAGATLTVGQGNGHIGTYGVVVPISLTSSSGINVAALNFDIQFDDAKLAVLDVTLGPAAEAAAKEVHFATPTTGTLRVVVYGINQNRIGDGVIANAIFDVSMSAPEGTIPLTLANVVAASPEATAVEVTNVNGSVVIAGQATTFADVPKSHWAWGYVEALYQAGVIAGCQTTPKRLYCIDNSLARDEMSVMVERGLNGAGYMPPAASGNVFSDMTDINYWGTKWAEKLYVDGFTAGCNASPLEFCFNNKHARNEMTVYMERMLHGKDYTPPTPTVQHYTDVGIGQNETWDSKWVYGAFDDQIIQECEDEANRGDQLFRPLSESTRAEIACVMAKAKGLAPVAP
jgi:hypothetical protein